MMDYSFYKEKFEETIKNIPQKGFNDAGLKLSIEIILESIALKIYKPEWSSDFQSPRNAKSRIFFSIWINDKTIKEGKLYYNIHALKLRELKGYKISSRNFAEEFRNRFTGFQKDWDNVSVKFGPLTLMEGSIDLKEDRIQEGLFDLAQKFLKISFIIDDTLNVFKTK